MKRKQKGGQTALPAATDPRSHHYTPHLGDGFVSEKMQECEAAHFGDSDVADGLVLGSFRGANTNTPGHVQKLEKCLVEKLYDAIPPAVRTSTPKATLIRQILGRATLPFPAGQAGKCTTDTDERVDCGTITAYNPDGQTLPPPYLKSDTISKLRFFNPDGTLNGGGSRKRKSRSPPSLIKNAKHNRMARKSTRRATRRLTSRKTSRKGSRKTRRSCRK